MPGFENLDPDRSLGDPADADFFGAGADGGSIYGYGSDGINLNDGLQELEARRAREAGEDLTS